MARVAAVARARGSRGAPAGVMGATEVRVTPVARLLAAAAALCILAPTPALGQQVADDFPIPQSLVEEVLPGAISFEVRDGDPRVIVGYAAAAPDEEALVGYAFLTSDVPPEELGYNGPIEVLVGMDREGVLSGVRVTHYVESYIRTRGDFLRTPGYEAQFTGKSISDPFRAKRDVRVVSRATISVAAMSRGIRASARRVYANYLATRPSTESGGSLLTIGMDELEELSWSDMVAGELVPQIHVLDNDVTRIVLSFAHIRSDSIGEMLVGRSRFGEVAEQFGERTQEDPLMLVGVDGALALLFYPQHAFSGAGRRHHSHGQPGRRHAGRAAQRDGAGAVPQRRGDGRAGRPRRRTAVRHPFRSSSGHGALHDRVSASAAPAAGGGGGCASRGGY